MNREMSALTLGVEPAFFDEYAHPFPSLSHTLTRTRG
jgi:hypothetical protein